MRTLTRGPGRDAGPESGRAGPASGHAWPASGHAGPASGQAEAARRPGSHSTGPQRPRMDPRIARRWTQVRRDQGRHRLRVLVVAAALVVVAGLAVGSLYSPLFEVRHVRVSVAGAVPEAEVLSLTGLSRPKPLIEVDTRAVAARLDAVPALGGARVSRSWPTTVVITITARTPVAVVARTAVASGAPTWATVDATGRVLADVTSPIVGLPVLQGTGSAPAPGGWLEGSPGPAAALPASGGPPLVNLSAAADSPSVPTGTAAALGVAAALPASVRPDVLDVIVQPGGRLSMEVLPATIAAGSILVTLGDGSLLAEKLTALATMLSQANLSGITAVDLSVPDRPSALTARQSPGTVSTQSGG